MSQGRKKKTKIQVKSPTQERSKQTVSSILEACARIIAREGYFAVTTDKIAVEAGVSIGSLYQFFGNKESVVAALIKQLIDDDRRYFFEKMRPYENLPPEEKIVKMLDIGFEIYRMNPQLRAALQAVRLYLTDQEYINQSRALFMEFVRNHLCHIAAPRNPDKVAFITVTAFLSILNNTTHDQQNVVNDPELVNELTLMFKKYLELK
ncbi:TetR/AcrR family transcriptional regulator [Bdellovibrio sp. HCB337]|uniref:TetR/AcrR family transcriptional regulator n=1 Tax=Bdellovibrio sp. HCB337 TaxID=3394358 RepID=UPI0039A588DC